MKLYNQNKLKYCEMLGPTLLKLCFMSIADGVGDRWGGGGGIGELVPRPLASFSYKHSIFGNKHVHIVTYLKQGTRWVLKVQYLSAIWIIHLIINDKCIFDCLGALCLHLFLSMISNHSAFNHWMLYFLYTSIFNH